MIRLAVAWWPTVTRRGRSHAMALALVVMLPGACRDEPAASPAIAEVRPEPEPEPAPEPAPPRRSLARRIAPLLEVRPAEPPPPREPPRDELGLPTIGVEECDDYLRQYLRCIERSMPEGSREPIRDALAQSADAWAEAAKNPATLEALRSACKTASESMRTAMAGMGCTWE